MKKFVFISVLLFSFGACSNEDNNSVQSQSIIGKWKLIEEYGSFAGEASQWVPIEDGYYYNFLENGRFSSNKYGACQTGNYSLTESQLVLNYSCEGFTTGIESPKGTFVENYSFENNSLFLTPTYLNCDEGCVYKFKKVEM